MDGLDDTTITVEAEYYIIFSEHKNNFYLNLHCNGSNGFFCFSMEYKCINLKQEILK